MYPKPYSIYSRQTIPGKSDSASSRWIAASSCKSAAKRGDKPSTVNAESSILYQGFLCLKLNARAYKDCTKGDAGFTSFFVGWESKSLQLAFHLQ